MKKYRIVEVGQFLENTVYQAQEKFLFFFWKDCRNSIYTKANPISFNLEEVRTYVASRLRQDEHQDVKIIQEY